MTLVSAYVHHRPALRASLRAEYGMDLRCPGIPLTDVGDLVAHLPQDSALWREVRGDEESSWGLQEMLLAAAVDELRAARWQFERVNFKGVSQTPPDPIPRPGVEPATKRHGEGALDIDEMAEWLGGVFAAQN